MKVTRHTPHLVDMMMKATFLCFLLGALCLALVTAEPPEFVNGKNKNRVPGEYIVSINLPDVDDKQKVVDDAVDRIHGLANNDRSKLNVDQKYIFDKFAALTVKGPDEALVRKIFSLSEVERIEANVEEKMIEQTCVNQNTGDYLWGLSRIAVNNKPNSYSSSQYSYLPVNNGANTYAYVIDTGIYTSHPEFSGRASIGYTVYKRGGGQDDNGHGTHCTGTILSNTYGVAKGARAIGVKVLDRYGSGTIDTVVNGLSWVLKDFTAKRVADGNYKAVASMSLSGSLSPTINDAVQNCINAGLPVVVAAGNNNADAANFSPSSVPDAITVGATDIDDNLASFSDYGTLVDILAPGVGIVSTYIGRRTPTATLSGTSMATPHVAGAVLRYQSSRSYAPSVSDIATWLSTTGATSDAVNVGTKTTTPNRLLYAPCVL